MHPATPTPTSTPATPSDLDRRFLLGGLAGAAGITALAAMTRTASAGPLNPPAGPIAPTTKPLGDLEPRTAVNATNTPASDTALFRITQPGSYYLTGNVNGVAGKRGIEITANNVTIDLAGFTLQGVTGSGEGIITYATGLSGITIRNGIVAGWTNGALNLTIGVPSNCRVEDIAAIDNGAGIMMSVHSLTQRCIAVNNAGHGFSAIAYCTFDRCSARGNAGRGFAAGNAAMITACTAEENGGAGISSDILGHITGCSCLSNTGDGILISQHNRVTGNLLYANGAGAASAAGLRITGSTFGGNHIENNTSIANDRGYHAESPRNIFLRNTACENTTANWDLAAGNNANVLSAAVSPAVIGNVGGLPLAPSGYDPSANFTLV